MSKTQYDILSKMQLLSNYILMLFLSIAIEITRISKDKVIDKQKQELQKFNENLQDIVDEKTRKIVKLQGAILKTMSNLVEYRDFFTGEHVERTQHGVSLLLYEIKKQALFAETINNLEHSLNNTVRTIT
jgi:putative two-component system response regulator